MPDVLIAAAVGVVTGVISAMGVGGGTLLILWLTLAAGVEQTRAQGINLLYFLPTALAAVILHNRRECLPWRAVILPGALGGILGAMAGAGLAGIMDVSLLRRLFGGYLLILGGCELFRSVIGRGNPRKK